MANVTHGPNFSYSFALGRDKIPSERPDKKLNSPGAGTYKPQETFGAKGQHYSMRRRLTYSRHLA